MMRVREGHLCARGVLRGREGEVEGEVVGRVGVVGVVAAGGVTGGDHPALAAHDVLGRVEGEAADPRRADGASTDPRAKAGLATLAANLATKGTATRSAETIAAEMERLGAELSASAGPDGTILFVTAPAANLEAAGRVLADVVQNATFPTDELERERKRNLDALSVALKDPGALADLCERLRLGFGEVRRALDGTPTDFLVNGQGATDARRMWYAKHCQLVVSLDR